MPDTNLKLEVNNMPKKLKTTSDPAINTLVTRPNHFNMTLRNVHVKSRDKYKKLKSDGKVACSFNAYIKQAVIDKLKLDDI